VHEVVNYLYTYVRKSLVDPVKMIKIKHIRGVLISP